MIRAVRRILLVLLVLATALPAHAAVFPVTKTADTLDGACDHDCSLREAVAAANASPPGPTVDVVVVPAGFYSLTRTGAGEDSNATGDLDVTGELILVGEGATRTFLEGNGLDRVLDVQARVEIFGVTIRHGWVQGSDRVTANGGGLLFRPPHSTPRSLLHGSVVSHNQALGTQQGGNGGGIAVFSSFLEVRESAVLSNHAAGDGGGIATIEGGFALRNATVTSNSADRTGGGLFYSIAGGTTVSSSTVVYNRAGISHGGIASRFFFPGEYSPQISGSIVALNTAPVIPDTEAASGGYNVFGIREEGCEPTDRCGTAAAPLDPRLALRYGSLGPTPVFALLDGSPALGLVPAGLCPSSDQVGQARSAPCEAGAWERVEVPGQEVCVPGGSVLCLQGGRFRVTAALKSTGLLDAQAVPLTVDTGNYWFFSPDNLEVMVKVLDGCEVNQHWWVFTSGLTDRGVILRVEELATGRTWSYETEAGKTYPPKLDTGAFDCESAPGGGTGAGDDMNVVAAAQAVLVVNRTADTFDGVCDHDCSLREAVAAANGHSGTSVILAGPGVYTLTRQGRGENAAILGDLDVTGDLVILGAGADRTVLDGDGIDRVLEVFYSLELHGVTVRNGRALDGPLGPGDGGGIRASDLALVRSLVTANQASHDGGGIHSMGLVVQDSTVSGNVAGGSGGGAWAETFLMRNVTVSGNRAGTEGGGLLLDYHSTSTKLDHVTVTDNSAPLGGGLAAIIEPCYFLCYPPSIEVDRTIVAGNAGGDLPDCKDLFFLRGGDNVFGVGEGCQLGPGTLMGTLAQPLDPRLGPLGLHGGTTPTHVPLAGSPVLDLAACLEGRDQRGRPRPAPGDHPLCDAGAVELLPGVCQPDEDTLCLGEEDRFEVTVEWAALGLTGPGKAVPLAEDTGALWFFEPDNLELTVKVLDGCGTNGRYWVFLSGLTDVGVEVTVRDTKTGETWSHTHAAGTPFQPRLDTDALEVCP